MHPEYTKHGISLMRKIRVFTYIFLFVMFSVPFWGAVSSFTAGAIGVSSFKVKDSILSVQVDSVKIKKDSLPSDSSTKKKSVLDAVVDYQAKDSIVMTSDNWGYLYGDGEVKYTTIQLKAEKISMSMDSSIVRATFGLDSVGDEFGYPVFSDGGVDYESKAMKYNFKTRKGYINNVITQQGEGYIVAEKAKKTQDEAFFMEDGRYTTCDDHDHPHFYLALTRAKVRPKKNVITGPAYLVIEDLPLPFIGLPFGFFPFSDKYSSGVIMPTFGDEMERGFFLRDGGYYFAINDNIDLALTGEIYTKGSWGLNARSSYRKRYKYSGSFDVGYLVTKIGDKLLPDYSVSKDRRITWTHSQDPKFNMYRTLSASVNYSTSSYDRNQINSVYNSDLFTQSTKSSSVNLTQRFPNSPWSVSATMNIDQRTRDSTISMTLPNMTFTMSRIFPFKRKGAVGAERWYEKIQLNYNGELRNSILTKENMLFSSSLQKDWKHAMRHSIPISATYTAFNNFHITPAIQYNERWYTDKVTQKWDGSRHVDADTTYTFSRVYDFNAAVSVQTRIYGFFTPLFSKSTTIRHIFSPSIGFSYAPDFSDPRFGFYDSYKYYDANGDLQTHTYSLFKNGMFGSPPAGKQGMINFQFENNLEMKYAANDTIKKISLIDNFSTSFSYNMVADSFKWTDIATNTRLKLSKSVTVNINATFDPYTYDLVKDRDGKVTGLRRIDELRISKKGTIGRLMRVGYAISPSINQDTFKKWFGGSEDKKGDPNKNNPIEGDPMDETTDGMDAEGTERKSLLGGKKDDGQYDADGYLKNDVKWSLSANYSFNYAYDMTRWNEKTREFKYKLTHNLGFNGSIQPTKNWSFNFSSAYDFETNQISYLNCNLSRNLHCWTLTASFIPLGPYQSYFVSIRANSSMLQDLKYDKRGRSSSYDPAWD